MIYQHRIVIARSGKLEQRHLAFQDSALAKLDDYGSRLIGAWEVYIGDEAGSAVWQLRQFDSLAAWAAGEQREFQNQIARALRATRAEQPQAVATLLTLVVIPVVYSLVDRKPDVVAEGRSVEEPETADGLIGQPIGEPS